MDQISGTTPTDASTPTQDAGQPADAIEPADRQELARPGFGSRGRARRRARFLRKARELAYRDLGGLVFNLHRFGQRNDALVLAKLNTLSKLDADLRTLESVLGERQPVTVLREAGITACPRCAAIHSSEDRFCPNCGLSMARNVDLPIAGPAVPAADGSSHAGPPQTAPPAPGQPPGMTPPAAPATSGPGGSAPGASANPTPSAPPPATATHAPVGADRPGTAAGGPEQEQPTEILRPGAPRQ